MPSNTPPPPKANISYVPSFVQASQEPLSLWCFFLCSRPVRRWLKKPACHDSFSLTARPSSLDISPFLISFSSFQYKNCVILYNHFSAVLASDHLVCGQKSYAGSLNCSGLQSEYGKAPDSEMFLLQMPPTASDPWRPRLRRRQDPASSSRYEPKPSEDRCCQWNQLWLRSWVRLY